MDILNILNKHQVTAVFNSCGIIAQKHPDIIKAISDHGHEISIHGYNHENFSKLKPQQIDEVLGKSELQFKKITGKKPVGFRAPYLYDPIFYDEKLYKILRKRGYTWTSNRQVTRIEEKFKLNHLPSLLSIILLPLSNLPVVFRDTLYHEKRSILKNIFWLYGERNSFDRNGIVEIPLASTMDNFLFGLPEPDISSPKSDVKNAIQTLKSQYDQCGSEFNLNFHDWIIGTSNRIAVLDGILKYIKSKDDNVFITATQMIN
jgi:peptidoglycan/xylan/chitin deacetylase (PgdA/CDA1 family)